MKPENNRFEFGKNWAKFLGSLDDKRVEEAKKSLVKMLGTDTLSGKTFLDIGSGSGIFSLAARQMGVTVRSFDYDLDSVNCTKYLKEKYYADENNWQVEQGDILDDKYTNSLGQYDIVYSWGVLHHTGNMYKSFENVDRLVKNGGVLYISIYNDQGKASHTWKLIKRLYNQTPKLFRFWLTIPVFIRLWFPSMIRDICRLKPFRTWQNYKSDRGMSPWRDVIDWLGGYPFEVAKPESVFNFFKQRNYILKELKTCAGGHGCNEFVFIKKTL